MGGWGGGVCITLAPHCQYRLSINRRVWGFGLKQQKTNFMFCWAFLALPIIIRVKTAKYNCCEAFLALPIIIRVKTAKYKLYVLRCFFGLAHIIRVKTAKYKCYVLRCIFWPWPSLLGLKQQKTSVMICVQGPGGRYWISLWGGYRLLTTFPHTVFKHCCFWYCCIFAKFLMYFYSVFECVCLNHPFRTPHLWSTDETL